MNTIEITKSIDSFDGTTRYEFAGIDEDGNRWNLGNAVYDGEGGYYGDFDTRPIYFEDDYQLEAIISKRKPNDDIVIR